MVCCGQVSALGVDHDTSANSLPGGGGPGTDVLIEYSVVNLDEQLECTVL